MKLLIITSIKEFENDIKRMLTNSEIKLFSYHPITGYRNHSIESVENNWFATKLNETDSIIFYAFVNQEYVDILFNKINEFNDQQESLSTVHVVILDIEKFN